MSSAMPLATHHAMMGGGGAAGLAASAWNCGCGGAIAVLCFFSCVKSIFRCWGPRRRPWVDERSLAGRELPVAGEYMLRGAFIIFKHAIHLGSRAGAAPGGRPAAPTLPLLPSTTSLSPATLPLSSRDNIERFGSVAEEKASPDRQAGAWPDG